MPLVVVRKPTMTKDKRKRETPEEIITNFSQTTTIPGMGKIFVATVGWKCIWILLFFGAIGVCGWQIGVLVTRFISYPVAVKVEFGSKEVDFPAVTVCNLNSYRKSALKDSDGGKILQGLMDQLDQEGAAATKHARAAVELASGSDKAGPTYDSLDRREKRAKFKKKPPKAKSEESETSNNYRGGGSVLSADTDSSADDVSNQANLKIPKSREKRGNNHQHTWYFNKTGHEAHGHRPPHSGKKAKDSETTSTTASTSTTTSTTTTTTSTTPTTTSTTPTTSTTTTSTTTPTTSTTPTTTPTTTTSTTPTTSTTTTSTTTPTTSTTPTTTPTTTTSTTPTTTPTTTTSTTSTTTTTTQEPTTSSEEPLVLPPSTGTTTEIPVTSTDTSTTPTTTSTTPTTSATTPTTSTTPTTTPTASTTPTTTSTTSTTQEPTTASEEPLPPSTVTTTEIPVTTTDSQVPTTEPANTPTQPFTTKYTRRETSDTTPHDLNTTTPAGLNATTPAFIVKQDKYYFDSYFTFPEPDLEKMPWYARKPDPKFQIRNQMAVAIAKIPGDQQVKMSHQMTDFIQELTFNGRNLPPSDLGAFTTQEFGICYTFNAKSGNASVYRAKKAGPAHGVSITMFIEQSEYLGEFSPAAGAKVVIHENADRPFPYEGGMDIAPGQLTSIGLKQRKFIRQGGKYGDCTNGTDKPFPGRELLYKMKYSVVACERSCLQYTTIDRCGCADAKTPAPPGTKLCDPQQDDCVDKVREEYMEATIKCDCPLPCIENIFDTSMSVSMWPALNYQDTLKKKLAARGGGLKKVIELSEVGASQNLLKLNIFFENLNYLTFIEEPAYPLESLLGDIGGQLGLWIGLSVFSGLEVIELLYVLLKSLYHLSNAEEENNKADDYELVNKENGRV